MTTPAVEHLLAALHEPEGRDNHLLGRLTEAEWTVVAELAIRQRVGPLLLSRAGLPLPGTVRDQLRKRAEVSAFKVLRQLAALRLLADRLAPQEIPLIALKGIHLASSVYANPGLREMNDIDVMVRPEHLQAAAATATELGYRTLGPPMFEAGMLHVAHHLPLLVNGRVGLEVHWRLARPGSPPLVEPDELWSRATESRLGANISVLSAEDTLVHVCVHATKHHFDHGVRPLCDVRALILARRDRLQWESVAERAARWNCTRSVALVLTLVRTQLGLALPADLPAAIGTVPGPVVNLAMSHLSSPPAVLNTQETAARLLSLPDASAKIRYLSGRIFLPPEQMAKLYPQTGASKWSHAAVVARRMGGLLASHGRALLAASLNPRGQLREGLDRRNALAAWIRGDKK